MLNTSTLSSVYFTNNHNDILLNLVNQKHYDTVFILADENTTRLCLPLFEASILQNSHLISIKSGESEKNLRTLEYIWTNFINNKASRKSVLINCGGGVIGDMGGLAASLFKRGIDFINIPTTLLAQVDASVGGKLAIDFSGLKNEIGIFKSPNAVIINAQFLNTLPKREIISGFAEMLKHGLIYNKQLFNELLNLDIKTMHDYTLLQNYIKQSVTIKAHFVDTDPTEKNIRKALNFGHTIGHAIESLLLETQTPLLHGEAILIGFICETYLATHQCNFNRQEFTQITAQLKPYLPKITINTEWYNQIWELMQHDKKNENQKINFTLLSEPGKYLINCEANKQLVFESINYFNAI